jgi:alkylation response protein AidB-like acyl-CoA dehydrogenase
LDTLRKGGVPTIGPGTTMLPANAIKATGSDELKARILPGVVAGETLICLGYTEPAGRIGFLRVRDTLCSGR